MFFVRMINVSNEGFWCSSCTHCSYYFFWPMGSGANECFIKRRQKKRKILAKITRNLEEDREREEMADKVQTMHDRTTESGSEGS